MTLLKLSNVCQRYPVGGTTFFGKPTQLLHAVKNVSLTIDEAETVAVVGESGCGKSTLGKMVSLLELPKDGSIEIAGVDPSSLSISELKALRKKLGLVFQDPYSALNPRMPISQLVGEPLEVYGIGNKEQREAKVIECLEAVGLSADALDRYPHEFSGGQRQRICIARALVLDPELIVADEPLSALDVSVQSQILNLFTKLKAARNLSFFFISHDMAVVDYLADKVVVMYLGQVVESAPREAFFENPAHPYSQALLNAVPEVGTGRRKKGLALQGDVPSPINPPEGCPFNPRCSKATERCRTEKPTLSSLAEQKSHAVSCHFPEVAVKEEKLEAELEAAI